MDMMSIFRIVSYTDLALGDLISNDWVHMGLRITQAALTFCFSVYQHYLSVKIDPKEAYI